jgi:predicted dithiol-disulfide oxidoreductase (DUF899 family)
MGWNFKWVSSWNTEFNFDHHVSFSAEELANKESFYNFITQDLHSSECEGVSVFYIDRAGRVFHMYSAYVRGIDILNVAYNYLDLIPGAEIRLAMNSISSGCAAMMNELSPYATGLEIIP